MVKMGKKKLKLLNKSPKGEKIKTKLVGKITKKKTGVKDPTSVKKKVSILKDLATKSNDLVDVKENKVRFAKSLVSKDSKDERKPPQPKQKPVEKQKKRQKTQIDDTKMLLKLMKKK